MYKALVDRVAALVVLLPEIVKINSQGGPQTPAEIRVCSMCTAFVQMHVSLFLIDGLMKKRAEGPLAEKGLRELDGRLKAAPNN